MTESHAHSSTHAPHEAPSPKKRRYGWRIALAVGVLLVTPLVLGGIFAAVGLRSTYGALQEAMNAAEQREFATAKEAFSRAEAGMLWIERGSRTLVFWRVMPVVRSYVLTLEESLSAAKSTLRGGQELLDVAVLMQEAFDEVGMGAQALQNPLEPTRTFRSLTRAEKRTILARLSQAMPGIRRARERMAIALDRWQNVPREGIAPSLSAEFDRRVVQFERIQEQFDQVIDLAEVALPLAGYPEKKSYLVILQNTQEARGTGGFIGTVGEVVVDSGDVEKMVFQDVYSIDNPVSAVWKNPSPEPIRRWLEQPNLFLRDANWSPDFPQSADTLLRQYVEERRLAGVTVQEPDALIALQPELFRRLLNVTGPIAIDDQVFTADTFFDALQYDVHMRFHQEGLPTPQRKEIVAQVGNTLFQRLTDIPVAQWPRLLEAVTDSLVKKDVLIYARDIPLQRELDARDWSGRTRGTEGDFLWVIDSNMGALKTDGVMEKQILYGVRLISPTEALATVTLRYQNTNPRPTWRYTRYRTYTRVYVPQGSELVSSRGAMQDDLNRTQGRLVPGTVDVYNELGKTVFGAFFSVEPGKTGEIQFTYRLPVSVIASLRQNSYTLLAQKQPGSYPRLAVDVQTPQVLRRADPAEDPKRYGDARYQASIRLEKDQLFTLQW